MKTHAAVIGSGFGGIATAIRLQSHGIQTTLIEKREKPGGRAYVYEDKGFVFDAGPTVITAPDCIYELFKEANRDIKDYVELTPVTPFYRLRWENGFQFDYSNDEEALLSQIRAKSPSDVEGYKAFYEYSKDVFKAGYTDLVHVPFQSFWDMVKVSPQLLKLKAYRSVYKMVSKYIKDEQLREAFSFHSLLIGGNPFHASSIYVLIHALEREWGVYFPKGGTHALVRALVKLFEDKGGVVKLQTEVDEILTNGDSVTGLKYVSGETEDFDFVVCNSDVTHTYQKLLRNSGRIKWKAFKLGKMRYSNSLFVVYFGTDKKYPDLRHHNILFGPRYRELLDDIFKKGVLADDFSLYLHVPTRTDPTLAPEGCETFYALSPVPNLGKSSIDWKDAGPKYAQRILDYLDKNYLPDLNKHIVTQRIFTPLDFQNRLNAHLGTAFSLEPTLLQSAYFRVHNRDDSLNGLYFVGAGTHPGAGVPGVINSAKATTSLILSDYAEYPELRTEPAHVF